MEVLTDAPSHREMEQRLNTLQTSLNVVERSIMKFKNLIEECRMLEEEVHHIEEDKAHLEEEICQEEEEEIADIEMVGEEERGDPKPFGPCGEADTEGLPPLISAGDAVSPEEDALLMQPAPQPEDPVGDLTAPGVRPARSRERWPSYASPPQANLGMRRMRPHHRSLPFSPSEVLNLSPPSPQKREVQRKKLDGRRLG